MDRGAGIVSLQDSDNYEGLVRLWKEATPEARHNQNLDFSMSVSVLQMASLTVASAQNLAYQSRSNRTALCNVRVFDG